jgi:hypothetical protein
VTTDLLSMGLPLESTAKIVPLASVYKLIFTSPIEWRTAFVSLITDIYSPSVNGGTNTSLVVSNVVLIALTSGKDMNRGLLYTTKVWGTIDDMYIHELYIFLKFHSYNDSIYAVVITIIKV